MAGASGHEPQSYLGTRLVLGEMAEARGDPLQDGVLVVQHRKVLHLGLRVENLGFRVQGSEFRV